MRFLNAFSILGRLFIAAALASVVVAIAFSGDARMAFLIVGLSIGMTGFVFALIGSRLGQVSSLDRTLQAVGVPGAATITSLLMVRQLMWRSDPTLKATAAAARA